MRARTSTVRPTIESTAAMTWPTSQLSRYVGQSSGSDAGVHPLTASLTGAFSTKKAASIPAYETAATSVNHRVLAFPRRIKRRTNVVANAPISAGPPTKGAPAAIKLPLHGEPEGAVQCELVGQFQDVGQRWQCSHDRKDQVYPSHTRHVSDCSSDVERCQFSIEAKIPPCCQRERGDRDWSRSVFPIRI
jgi:hypothetical protein